MARKKILMFRLGSGKRASLSNVNLASFNGVIEFAYRAIDRHMKHGDTLELWEVDAELPLGEYEHYNGGVKQGAGPSHGKVGKKKSGWGFWYSVPAAGGAFKARRVGSATLDELGKIAGYDEKGGRGGPGWWYISEIPIDQERTAAEKAFKMRIPKE